MCSQNRSGPESGICCVNHCWFPRFLGWRNERNVTEESTMADDLAALTRNVDAVIGNLATSIRLPKPARDALKVELARQSLAFHCQANPPFRHRCALGKLTAAELLTLDDLRRIPLTPVTSFKRTEAGRLLSVPL